MSTTDQVKSFISFFSRKRDLTCSELDAVFRDNKETRLMDDMFSKDEVEGVLDGVLIDTKDTVRKELERATKMAALVVEQLLNAGTAAGVDLSIDMSKAEDEGLLSRVGTASTASAEADMKLKGSAVKLDSIRDEHAATVAELDRLREENKKLNERYMMMQTRATSAVKEVSDLNQQLARAEGDLESERSRSKSVAVVKPGDDPKVAELEERVRRLEGDLEASESARKEAESTAAAAPSSPDKGVPVSQTKQFRQLKDMLQKKNQQLTEARRRLAKYEPDDAREVDEREEAAFK